MEKECLHYWDWGYLGDSVIYCTKCNKDADDVYSEKDFSYATHTCKSGQIIFKELNYEKRNQGQKEVFRQKDSGKFIHSSFGFKDYGRDKKGKGATYRFC